MRRVVVALLVAAAVSTASTQASHGGESPGFRWVVVKTGRIQGGAWALSAIDSGDGRYCVKVVVTGSPRAKKCGRFYVPGPTGVPVRLGWAFDSRGPGPTFVVGAVTEAARHVAIRLSGGDSRIVAAIPPRVAALSPGISFFIEPKSCAAYPIAITARNAAGRVVAGWRRPPTQRPPVPHC